MADQIPPQTPPPTADQAQKKRRRKRGVRNPGFFGDRDQEFKKVSEMSIFNGGKLEFSAAHKNAVVHFNAAMDASLPGGMTLDTGLDLRSPGDKQVMSASLNQDFATTGKYAYKFDKRTTCKVDFLAPIRLGVELNQKAPDNCNSAKVSFEPTGALFAVSHMRSVHPLLAVGAELSHVANQSTTLSLAARCKRMFRAKGENKPVRGYTATLEVDSNARAHATYTHMVSPELSFATDFTVGAGKNGFESSANAYARYDYQSFMMQAKCSPLIGTIGGFLETRHNPSVSTLFTGELNHFTGDSLFGMGVRINT